MASVFDVLKSSGGSIPLDELVLRSSGSPEHVAESVSALQQSGVVKVTGPIPYDAASVSQAAETTVELADMGALLR